MAKLGIVPKLTLVFVVFAAALLAAVGALTYSRGRVIVQQEVISELYAVAGEKQAALDSWVGGRQTDIANLAASPAVIADLAALAAAAPRSSQARAAHDQLVALLTPYVIVSHEYVALLVMEPVSGQVIAATQPAYEGTLQADRPYFINGKSMPYVQNFYFPAAQQAPAMTAAAPVRSDSGQLLGVLAGHLNLAEFDGIASRRTGLRQTNDSYLVNNQGLLATQPNFLTDPAVLQNGIHTAAAQACLAHNSGQVLDLDYRGVPAIVVYRWLPEQGLCLVVKLDQEEAFAPAVALGREIFLIALVALAAATMVAIVLARSITRPMVALQAAAARVSAGDASVRVPETSSDELGRLAGEFNRMALAVAGKETKLREHAEQLSQANHELEAFSYSVSHDLRAPLRAIDGFSRILLEDYAGSLDAEGQRYLKIVRDNTQQMGHLIDDLLSLSRAGRQPINMQPIAPAELIRKVLLTLQAEQNGRRVDVIIGELPDCRGDPALLTQVFTNLLGNALKYTRRRETGRIEIGCRVVEGENVYFVKDNGAGFDMQYAQKLFGVFQRLHRADEFEGTGVGLAIVQRIIARHGGRIWAEAAVEQGATFYFTLPAAERAEPEPLVAQADPLAQRLSELV